MIGYADEEWEVAVKEAQESQQPSLRVANDVSEKLSDIEDLLVRQLVMSTSQTAILYGRQGRKLSCQESFLAMLD